MRETAIRCERPQGVEPQPGELRAGAKVVVMFRAPESGTEYMRISGENGDDWFRIRKTLKAA